MRNEHEEKSWVSVSAIVAVIFVVLLGAVVWSAFRPIPVFSTQTLLESTWYHYKLDYLEPETFRSLDRQQHEVTTSEGQSYTLLRAVWMDDRATFDAAWKWTKTNLQRPEDHLISWLFGQRTDGSYGIISEQGGENAATDADEDIALALLFASERWHDAADYADALLMIQGIWEKEVMVIGGKPYLVANNVEKTESGPTALVNPSYFAPYAYRIFASVDPAHDWMGVVDTSYEILDNSSRSVLDGDRSAGLPPDWITIDKTTGVIGAFNGAQGTTTNYSYDALRIPWRLSLDETWFHEPRATTLLQRFHILTDDWNTRGSLAASYAHDGAIVAPSGGSAMYGGAIGAFMAIDSKEATSMYMKNMESLYDSTLLNWKSPLSYYDANWLWFGIGLYNGKFVNFYSPTTTVYDEASIPLDVLPRVQ